MQDQNDRQRLVEAIRSFNARMATIAELEKTKIQEYPFPLSLKHYQLYALRYPVTGDIITDYVAIAENLSPCIPTAWFDFEYLLQADGFILTTPEQALEYVLTAFALLPYIKGRFFLISHARDLPIWDEQKKLEIISGFEPIIAPPAVTFSHQGFIVTFYAIHDNMLKHYSVLVSPTGQMEETITMIAEKLPMPIYRSLTL